MSKLKRVRELTTKTLEDILKQVQEELARRETLSPTQDKQP